MDTFRRDPKESAAERQGHPTRRTMRTTVTILALLLTTPRADAQRKRPPDAPAEMYIVPMAVPPGRDTPVTFLNAPAGRPTGIWTNLPGKPALAATEPRVSLDVPAQAPVGIYALRLATASAVSKLQLFMIDDLDTVQASRRNTSPATAQRITPPVAVEGACDPLACDYYRFAARKGQRLAFEAVARRLGSRTDPVLRLLDGAGRELAAIDDTPGLSGDFRFAHTFDADGEYVVEFRDADYQGAADRRYRLRVGDFPVATVPFPLAGHRGAGAAFSFEGNGSPTLGPIELQFPRDRARINFGLTAPDGGPSAMFSVLTAETADVVATAPNSSRETAVAVSIPANISGRFARPGALRHYYAFDAKQGEKITARGQTRSLGSAATLDLEILKPDGSSAADAKPRPKADADKPADPDDGLAAATIPADGRYFLAVAELTNAGGPGHVYRVEVARVAPGYSLAVDADRLTAPAGGTAKLKVKCARRSFDGPVQLTLDGAPGAWQLRNATIAKGKNETELEIVVPASPRPGAPLAFRVAGTATVDGRPVTSVASTADALKATFPKLSLAMPELDGWIGLAVTAADGAKAR
jgi:hypothetical protein